MAGNKRTSIVLQERDLRLIEALEIMRVVDREQARVVAGFHSTRRVNDRLLALTRAGFLKQAFVGSHQAVYWLPGKGPQDGDRKRGVAGEPAALFLRHRLEINRVHLLVGHASIPISGWWFVRWQGFQKPLSATLPLIPDGYFEIGSQQGFRPMFVEVDLGTESTPALAKKASLYVQLATSGEFSQIFGRSQFRVLVITTSERRLENLRSPIGKLTDKIFWFATLDAVSPEKFWTVSWLRPASSQLQSLL